MTPSLLRSFSAQGLSTHFYLDSANFRRGEIPRIQEESYLPLKNREFDSFYQGKPLLHFLMQARRFLIPTETADMRLRERLDQLLCSQGRVSAAVLYGALIKSLQALPGSRRAALALEQSLGKTSLYSEHFTGPTKVLTPGIGGFGFWQEAAFAREAIRAGVPVYSTITNYDNLVNMGYRGFRPKKLFVWSELMAQDAMRLHDIPASAIEITGPIQFDRYLAEPALGRGAFLKKVGLDPARKTILFCGGINVMKYFDIFELFCGEENLLEKLGVNLAIRPYPHEKFFSSSAWASLEKLLRGRTNIYVSDATLDSDPLQVARKSSEDDELHLLFKHSDLMINVFSTVALEAAICDLPTIHLGYEDFRTGLSYFSLTDFQQRQTHNRRPLRLAASAVAQSKADLIRQIEAYLAKPEKDAAARAEYARSECGLIDGKASERLADFLKQG